MARKAGEPLSARCRLGQHANPSESNAMPKHRPSSVPAPETSAPSSNVTTIAIDHQDETGADFHDRGEGENLPQGGAGVSRHSLTSFQLPSGS